MKQISKATTGLDCASHIYLGELCPGIDLRWSQKESCRWMLTTQPDRSARPHMAQNIWKFHNVRITIPVAWMKNTSFKDVKALG